MFLMTGLVSHIQIHRPLISNTPPGVVYLLLNMGLGMGSGVFLQFNTAINNERSRLSRTTYSHPFCGYHFYARPLLVISFLFSQKHCTLLLGDLEPQGNIGQISPDDSLRTRSRPPNPPPGSGMIHRRRRHHPHRLLTRGKSVSRQSKVVRTVPDEKARDRRQGPSDREGLVNYAKTAEEASAPSILPPTRARAHISLPPPHRRRRRPSSWIAQPARPKQTPRAAPDQDAQDLRQTRSDAT